MRLEFDEIKNEIKRVFMKYGMSEERAEICARVHTETTYDGIYSHGTNRVSRFVDYIKKGWVDVNATPTVENSMGAMEILDCHTGPGILNALFAADRGMELAEQYGIAMVGLKNTTHWMRGGTYGLHVAKKGYISIMWTNTESCMPPWGGKDCKIGNNPFVMSLPNPNGDGPAQIDMAMSQFAYGKLQVTRLAGKELPFPGGFDSEGKATVDPGAVEKTRRIMPMGYWKGSAFAFMLDVLACALTGGGMGAEAQDKQGKGSCTNASQVMIIIDPKKIIGNDELSAIVDNASAYIKSSALAEDSTGIYSPGEGHKRFHKDHDENGIFVDDSVWAEIKAL